MANTALYPLYIIDSQFGTIAIEPYKGSNNTFILDGVIFTLKDLVRYIIEHYDTLVLQQFMDWYKI